MSSQSYNYPEKKTVPKVTRKGQISCSETCKNSWKRRAPTLIDQQHITTASIIDVNIAYIWGHLFVSIIYICFLSSISFISF